MSPRRADRGAVLGGGERNTTVVSFHAHPDDEALLTGGSLAAAAAAGHRVVLVVATLGEAGLAESGTENLGARRQAELDASAAALGVSQIIWLGYADSGLTGDAVPDVATSAPTRFCDAPVEEAAQKLAEIVTSVGATTLTGYDRNGGYGHPDHLQVHRVARRAAAIAGTPRLLEATIDRTWFAPLVRLLRTLARIAPLPQLPSTDQLYLGRDEIDLVADVRGQLDAKLGALSAHASQSTGGPRTIALLVRLPRPLARVVLGREWFHQVSRPRGE